MDVTCLSGAMMWIIVCVVLLPGKLLRYSEMSSAFRNLHKLFTINRINTPSLVCWESHKLAIKMINESYQI